MDDPDWGWFYAGLRLAELSRRRPFDPDTLARLERARELIERRLDEPVALDELARAACYSRFHFLRCSRPPTRTRRAGGRPIGASRPPAGSWPTPSCR
jgi:hypothetical protein